MKKFLKISLIVVAVVVVIGVGIYGAAMYMTSGMVKSADTFLEDVAQHHYAAAEGLLSHKMRAVLDEKKLGQFATQAELVYYKESHWPNRSINGDQGVMTGTFTTTKGDTIPIAMRFVKENGNWLVYRINVR